MKWVPFTVHIKITPATPGKRFENWRDMQKIANLVYESLEAISPDTVNIAIPGGGQHRSFSGKQKGGIGGMVNGTAVKPRFGDFPAQLMLTGFYKSETQNLQPYSELERIHCGNVMYGPGEHSWDDTPTSTIDTEVSSLKLALETAIDAGIPGNIFYKIYRIDYSGIIYGNRGYHFPV